MARSKKLLVIDVAALGWNLVSDQPDQGRSSFKPMASVFPAVTCTAQAAFRTGLSCGEHGMVSNGLYFKDLQKPMFWEQASSLVEGERLWKTFKEQGGTVGLMFWQQSLGEDADLLVSPKPIHKHSGGMMLDCYSQPHDLYAELCTELGRPFNLMNYWGPMASHKSSDWIVDAVEAVLKQPQRAPDLLMCYIPHLDYALQKYGPGSSKAKQALQVLMGYLDRLHHTAQQQGYEVVVFGDYTIAPTQRAVFPNRALRDAGLFHTRTVKGRAYPDFYHSPAVAIVDHEVAHVITKSDEATEKAREVLSNLEGVGDILDRSQQEARGWWHDRSGELLITAKEGSWLAYPWWTDRREAPDFATHVDIHNKPGYDPCELFFGWPPLTVSMDTTKVKGTHGQGGPGREVAWSSTIAWDPEPKTVEELGQSVKNWLTSNV